MGTAYQFTFVDIDHTITDSSSWPMLTIWDIDGEADVGTLGMKRDMSATDDMLIASSSRIELAEKSCIKKSNAIFKSYKNVKQSKLRSRA